MVVTCVSDAVLGTVGCSSQGGRLVVLGNRAVALQRWTSEQLLLKMESQRRSRKAVVDGGRRGSAYDHVPIDVAVGSAAIRPLPPAKIKR